MMPGSSTPAYREEGELHATIEYVIKILLGIRRSLEPHGQRALERLDVRLTTTMPSFCGVLAGTRGHVNIYMDHLTGSRGPYFEIVDRGQESVRILPEFERSFDLWWAQSPSLFTDDLVAHHERMRAASQDALDSGLPVYLRTIRSEHHL